MLHGSFEKDLRNSALLLIRSPKQLLTRAIKNLRMQDYKNFKKIILYNYSYKDNVDAVYSYGDYRISPFEIFLKNSK